MDNDAIKFIKLGFSIGVDELFFNLYIPSVCTSPGLDNMDVVCVFNLQVITWFQRMNHPVNSIAVLNLLLVCIAKWNAWQAIFIHNNDIIWSIRRYRETQRSSYLEYWILSVLWLPNLSTLAQLFNSKVLDGSPKNSKILIVMVHWKNLKTKLIVQIL